MKKYFFMIAVALCMGMVTACGDDEPTGGSGGNGGNSGSTVKFPLKVRSFDGNLLTGLENDYDFINFNYSNGALISMSSNDLVFGIQDNMYVLEDDESLETESDFTLNKDGLITSYKYTYTDDEEHEVIIFNNEYDGKYLTSCTWNGSGENEDGEFAYTYKITFTWKNGNITRADYTYQDEDGSESGYYLVTYGTTPNAHKQYSLLMSSMLDLDGADYPLIGLFGDGPALLPKQIADFDEEDGDNSIENLVYELNSNGTIAAETELSEYDGEEEDTYRYYYNGETPKKVSALGVKRPAKPSRAKILRHHRHAKR